MTDDTNSHRMETNVPKLNDSWFLATIMSTDEKTRNFTKPFLRWVLVGFRAIFFNDFFTFPLRVEK